MSKGLCYFCETENGTNKGKRVRLYPWYDWWICEVCFLFWTEEE